MSLNIESDYMVSKLQPSDSNLFYNFNLLTDFPNGYSWENYFVGVDNSVSGLGFARILSSLSDQQIRFEIIEAMDKDSADKKIANFEKIILGIDLTEEEVEELIRQINIYDETLKISYKDDLLTLEI